MQTRLPFDDRPKPRHTGVTRPRVALEVFRGPFGAFLPEAKIMRGGRGTRYTQPETIARRWTWQGEAANDVRKGPRMLPSGFRSWADLDAYYDDLASGRVVIDRPMHEGPEP